MIINAASERLDQVRKLLSEVMETIYVCFLYARFFLERFKNSGYYFKDDRNGADFDITSDP